LCGLAIAAALVLEDLSMAPEKRTLLPLVGLIVLGAAFAALAVYIRHSPAFSITHVAVRGTAQLNPEDLVESLNIQPHTNIFQIQLDEIQARLESLPWVRTATVFRTIPNKLRIDITERQPFALVKLDHLYIIDREGVILGALASGSAITLPIITGENLAPMRVDGQNAELRPLFLAVERLLRASPPVVKDVRRIVIHSLDNVVVSSYDPAYPEIRVSLRDDAASLDNIARFQQIFPTLEIDRAAYVDLRFDRRIIVMPQNKS
jgi:cell division protein FtsQ